MSPQIAGARGTIARVRRWAASSAWAGLTGKAAAYLLGFALLALVGSGRVSRWLTPPGHLGIGVAEAATAPPPTSVPAPPSTTAAPVPEAAAAPAAAGAPAEVETVGAKGDAGAPPTEAASKGVGSDGKIILNLAVEEDLRRLPGIGHTRAQAILALRAQMKKFTRVEDLLKVKGIGRRALARLRPLVRVD
jgi:competence protein ComEA